MDELVAVVFRSVVVYLFIVLAIRVFGKREIAQLSVVDLVLILLISNSVQNAMVGQNSSLFGGIVAATALFSVNFLLEKLIFHSKKFGEILQGDAIMLIYQGKVLREHLAKADISMEELEAAVREHGVENIADVDLAVLETDGNISVMSNNYKHKTTKRRKAHKVLSKNT